MVGHRGATLLLDNGRKCISTSSFQFPPSLGYGENEPFLKVFVLAYTKFLSDSPLELTSEKPLKVYMGFFKKLITTDLRLLIKEFSGIAHDILSKSYVTGSESTTGYFCDAMKATPVFKEYLTWHRTRRPELLKYLISFLTFGKKLEYQDEQLDATALREWYKVEERLKVLEFTENDTRSLRNIISVLLAPHKIDHLLPKFGSGKVAQRGVSDAFDKFDCLQTNWKLDFAFGRRVDKLNADLGFGSSRTIPDRSGQVNPALMAFVPKDITKSRSMCMEPNENMYFQQEVMRLMVRMIEDGPASRFIDLKDQSHNQRAALHGSIYGSSDTLDLSSASDSVHIDLVRRVFPPYLLKFMLATRSSEVKIAREGKTVPIKKFAPMGSAVCFPTQCVLFLAVSLYAYEAHRREQKTGSFIVEPQDVLDLLESSLWRFRSPDTPFTRKYEAPVIYGDDIIVDTRVSDGVITTLERLGFSVNVNKSFTGGQSFRESCGVFAYEGDDVTPVLFRVPFFKEGNWDASIYTSLIEMVNNARDNGYHSVAAFYLSLLNGYGFRNRIPFTENRDAFGIFTLQKRKVPKEALRWNADWQIHEEKVQGIGPRIKDKEPPKGFDAYLWTQWWRSRVRGGVNFSFGEGLRIRPQETRLTPLWARCEM